MPYIDTAMKYNWPDGKRQLRQAKNDIKTFTLDRTRVRPGMEAEADHCEHVIRQQIGVVQRRGYSRKRATAVAMLLHRDLLERITA